MEAAKEEESDFNMDDSSPNVSDSISNYHKKINKKIKKSKKKNKHFKKNIFSNILSKKSKILDKKMKIHKDSIDLPSSPEMRSNQSLISPIIIKRPLKEELKENLYKSKILESIPENVCHDEVPFYCQNCTHLSSSLFLCKVSYNHFIPNGYKDFLNARFINEVYSLLNLNSESAFECNEAVELLFDKNKLNDPEKKISPNEYLNDIIMFPNNNQIVYTQSHVQFVTKNTTGFFVYLNDFPETFNKRIHKTLLKSVLFAIQCEFSIMVLFIDFKFRDFIHNLVLVLQSMIKSLYLLRIQTTGGLSKADKKHVLQSIKLCLGKYEYGLVHNGFYPRTRNDFSEVSGLNIF
jgi:hypothetical protein